MPLSRADIAGLDAADPFASSKDRFLIPDGIIYMNGNSLGPLSKDARNRMRTVVDEEWGQEMVRGWNSAGWFDITTRVGDKIARLIGANPGETVLCDGTSINLFKTVAAAVRMQQQTSPDRCKIISEAGNFPTDLYILDGIKEFMAGEIDIQVLPREDIQAAIDETTAAVVLTHVHYITGEIFPMAEMTASAHEHGALMIWDLSHSTGAVDTKLNACNADFAVGCGYKHLNGGPGAPGFLFAAKRHHAAMRQPLSGWFGHKSPFAFDDDFEPVDDIRRMLCGTTPILSASAFEASLDMFAHIDLEKYYEKRQKLSSIFCQLVEDSCAGMGLSLVSPNEADRRGAHISYHHENGYAIVQALIAGGVICDFRAPHYIRLGFSPLFMSYMDMWRASEILYSILANKVYDRSEYQTKNAVT